MTNDGGRTNEPSSYGLRPPQAAGAAGAAQAAGAAGATPPVPPVPGQGGYEPTRYSQAPSGPTPSGPDPRSAPAAQGPGEVPGPVAPEPVAPDAGRVIGGRYRLRSRLGHGGMGTVWRAHDEVVDRDVAVKEPRVPDSLPERDRQTVYQRMEREARAAARIDHPSVVTVHDVVVEDGRPWIVMELVRGNSLGDRLAEGTLEPREAARIGLAVLGALAAAHEAGVLHRDVKPDNVLLGRGDRVVLTDFGIAQVEGEQGLTETGAFVGSPEFIAPERVLGQRPGPESDLWSLGVVLYAAVEGVSPFRRSHTPATMQAILTAEPQTPTRGSGALGMLIMQLLRKEPASRPPAQEIRQTLESVARPPQPAPTLLATRASADGGGSRFVPPVLHRNRKAQAGLGVLVLALAAVLVLVLADPFTSEGMPEGWTVREEPEIAQASLAVPEGYTREVDDSDLKNQQLTFKDPSGVFEITLTRSEPDGADDASSALGAATAAKAYYEKGADSTMQNAHATAAKASQQGRKAHDLTTDYQPYGEDDSILFRQRERFYVNEDKVEWDLAVTMPKKGDARADGDRLYENVVKYLKIQDSAL